MYMSFLIFFFLLYLTLDVSIDINKAKDCPFPPEVDNVLHLGSFKSTTKSSDFSRRMFVINAFGGATPSPCTT